MPSVMQATGMASVPGRAHYRRAGTPTKQANIVFAVDGLCLIICKGRKGRPHGVQSTESEIHGANRDKRVRSTTQSSGV